MCENLELGELLHELLLLLAIAEGGQDVEENLEQIQILPGNTREREDRRDAAHRNGVMRLMR